MRLFIIRILTPEASISFEGNANLLRLHSEIYTGILADQLRKDIPFVPHLTLGVLDKDWTEPSRVLEEATQLGIDHYGVLDTLHLLKLNEERSKIL